MNASTTPTTAPRPVLPVLPLGTVGEAPQEFRRKSSKWRALITTCGGHKLADGPRTPTKPLVGARFGLLRPGLVDAIPTAPDARV